MSGKLTVVHANDLVEASYSLSLNEIRLIILAATKYDSRSSVPLSPISIHVNEFISAFDIDQKSAYRELKNAVNSILTKPVRIYKNGKLEQYSWILGSKYEVKDGSHVELIFSPLISDLLFQLKENFTSINFEYAARLNTPFSFRLYQWLKKVENLRKNQENRTITKIITIEDIKSRAQINGYPRWQNFNDYVIKPAVDKINANTDISVFYEPVKTGRKVTAVKFNYVVEKDASCVKPVRPRLYRRPKVMKGTHEEGVWMRNNLALLLEYEAQLKRYDDKEKLALTDLRKIAEYASICDRITEDRVKKEIELRTIK